MTQVFEDDYVPSVNEMIALDYEGQKAIRIATGLDALLPDREHTDIELYHPVTGRQVATVNLVNGRVTGVYPKYEAMAVKAIDSLRKAARDVKIRAEIENSRSYPVRHAERIKDLRALLGEVEEE